MLLKWAQSSKLKIFFIILQLWEPANIVARFGVCLPGKNERPNISFQPCKVFSSLLPKNASRGIRSIVKEQDQSV